MQKALTIHRTLLAASRVLWSDLSSLSQTRRFAGDAIASETAGEDVGEDVGEADAAEYAAEYSDPEDSDPEDYSKELGHLQGDNEDDVPRNPMRELLASEMGPSVRDLEWASSDGSAFIGGVCEDPAMEDFRRDNQSLPGLQGQVLKAIVIAVDENQIEIDPGYKYTQRLFKSELQNVPIYDEDGTRLGIPKEFEVGDIIHVKVDMLETPFNDMQLSLAGQLSEQDQVQAVMDRLQLAQDTDTPVMGRILNTVNRGYAVGIAGVVCFCPVTQCLLETSQRIGVLQPFKVLKMKPGDRSVTVYDAKKSTPWTPDQRERERHEAALRRREWEMRQRRYNAQPAPPQPFSEGVADQPAPPQPLSEGVADQPASPKTTQRRGG